jgi:hypothetical protein
MVLLTVLALALPYTASGATEMLTAFRGRTVKGVSVFRGDLELGSKDEMELPMRISVHAYVDRIYYMWFY